jgi:predicted SprT family Zn-dependent metalloprotease
MDIEILNKSCSELSKQYNVKEPEIIFVEQLNVPVSKISNWKLNNYGNGAYVIKTKTIIIETNNPKTGEPYSDEAIINCLAHELAHHFENEIYGDFGTHKGKFTALVKKIKKAIIQEVL